MKFLLITLGFFAIVASVFCADCEYAGKSLKIGETYVVAGTCSIMECVGKGALRGTACPSIDALPPCHVVEDESKLFPDCCPRVECPEDRKSKLR